MFKQIALLFKNILLWLLSYIIPKQKWLYLFSPNWWKTFSWNTKSMFLYYKKNSENKLFYILNDVKDLNVEHNMKHHFIQKKWIKFYILYLRAELIFIDWTLLDMWILSLILWKFKIINLWHWEPIKKLWFSNKLHFLKISKLSKFLINYLYCKRIFLSITWSKVSKKNLEDAFLHKYSITWLPRYDTFYDKYQNIENINKKIWIYNYKKSFLYVPTWRFNEKDISPFSNNILGKINNYMKKNNYIFYIKWHLCTDNINIDNYSNIKNISNTKIDIQELLNKTDCIITDYSSIYIDFLLTWNDIIFYAYDLEKYLSKSNEMYFDYDEVILKDTLCYNENDLLNIIKNIDTINKTWTYLNDYIWLKNKFHKYQKWWNCKRVDQKIKELK